MTEKTVSQALREAIRSLTEAGVDSAAHEARLLMAEAINRSSGTARRIGPMDLVMHGGDAVPEQYAGLVHRRLAREPLQWILGYGTVLGLELPVAPGLFIPRPETDLLIEWAATEAAERARTVTAQATDGERLVSRLSDPAVTIIDLCSGPGTVALGVAHLLTEWGIADTVAVRIIGLELDPSAVAAARDNAAAWVEAGHVSSRIHLEFHRADVASPTPIVQRGLVAAADLVVSNPPYVPENTPVSPEVEQDPHAAVFSGDDGLDLLRSMVKVIDMAAAPVAALGIEHDDSNGAGLRELLENVGVDDLVQHQDLAGRDRFVTGQVNRDPGHRPVRG